METSWCYFLCVCCWVFSVQAAQLCYHVNASDSSYTRHDVVAQSALPERRNRTLSTRPVFSSLAISWFNQLSIQLYQINVDITHLIPPNGCHLLHTCSVILAGNENKTTIQEQAWFLWECFFVSVWIDCRPNR